ncbi:MAG: DUF1836 domain-containing protein [Ruminococcaceae bacterium]|nr:DUF1836 domain-containing protein [Oscillospiraceae bacterium]
MNSVLKMGNIPGTMFSMEKMGGAVGEEFLDKVYYITNGIMLAQIREITGIDGTTLQNWVKRGWVSNPKNKMYDKEQLSRILIINMMRDTMQLSRIVYLMTYINGTSEEDKIIKESVLYDMICRVILGIFDERSSGLNDIDKVIDSVLKDYEETVSGALKRVKNGIRVIVITYYSAMIKASADDILDSLGADTKRKR